MTRTPRSRHLAVAGAVAAVAALAVGGATLRPADRGDRPAASARLAGGSLPPAAGVALDVGPVTDPADVAACLTPGFATDPTRVTVVYGQVQRSPDGTVPVLVLRNPAGEIRLCDVFGGDYPSQAPLEEATATDPVTFWSSGRQDWSCRPDGRTLRRFLMTEWLSVAGEVDTVRLRFVVDGAPGAWFSTGAVDGLAHLQAWLDGPLPYDAHVVVEQQVLDATGAPVAQSALPGRQRLPGCSAGSVQLG